MPAACAANALAANAPAAAPAHHLASYPPHLGARRPQSPQRMRHRGLRAYRAPAVRRQRGAGALSSRAYAKRGVTGTAVGVPDHVVGSGTPASCTSAAVVSAVASGGYISFRCGRKPVTITMTATAKVVNTSRWVVLDGGGLVTLSGGGRHQILYQNTCDRRQLITASDCYDQQ